MTPRLVLDEWGRLVLRGLTANSLLGVGAGQPLVHNGNLTVGVAALPMERVCGVAAHGAAHGAAVDLVVLGPVKVRTAGVVATGQGLSLAAGPLDAGKAQAAAGGAAVFAHALAPSSPKGTTWAMVHA